MNLRELLEDRILVGDGATGTLLGGRGFGHPEILLLPRRSFAYGLVQHPLSGKLGFENLFVNLGSPPLYGIVRLVSTLADAPDGFSESGYPCGWPNNGPLGKVERCA